MKGSVDAKKRSVGQFVKHLSGMGIKADASAMPNLKTRTLPGAPAPTPAPNPNATPTPSP